MGRGQGGHSTHPKPKMADPMIGKIQCTQGYVVNPNQNRPMVINGAPTISGGNWSSGSPLAIPVCSSRFSMAFSFIRVHIGDVDAASTMATKRPRKLKPTCQRLKP